MNKKQVEQKITSALQKFVESSEGIFLIGKNCSERSITHKFAFYLQEFFPEYDIDCEFNKMVGGDVSGVVEKHIKNESVSKHKKIKKNIKNNDGGETTVFPDIVIHKRHTSKNNLLIIECKKHKSLKKDKFFDFLKLDAFMKTKEEYGLGYRFSSFVEFNTESPEKSSSHLKQVGEKWLA